MAAERKGETEADRQQKPGLEWFMELQQRLAFAALKLENESILTCKRLL